MSFSDSACVPNSCALRWEDFILKGSRLQTLFLIAFLERKKSMGRYLKMAAAGLLCIAIVLVSLIVWLNLDAIFLVSTLSARF